MTMNILNISTFHEPSLYSPLLSLHLLLPQTYPKSWFLALFYFSYLFSCKIPLEKLCWIRFVIKAFIYLHQYIFQVVNFPFVNLPRSEIFNIIIKFISLRYVYYYYYFFCLKQVGRGDSNPSSPHGKKEVMSLSYKALGLC